MMRFSFVFLWVAVSMLSYFFSNSWLSEAAAVRNIPLEAHAAFETPTLKNDEVECGVKDANVNERIVGGEEAKPHAWPWQALLYCSNGTYPYMCGGSLVADKWVITAAHCVASESFTCLVLLGRHSITTFEPEEVITGIEKRFVHEQYTDSNKAFDFDIALVKLNNTVKYGKDVKPICLPFDLPELESTSYCYATGWGRVGRNKEDSISNALKQLQMTIVDDCNLEQKICAGSLNDEDDVCYGDSGGPLACREADRKWYLRGLTSYGPENCSSEAVFTKVAAYRDWFREKIASEVTKREN